MLKRFLALAFVPLLLAGCKSTFTNLTPSQLSRNPTNLYPVEVALDSRQQTLRWETIQPQLVVGKRVYPMRPTPYMTNRFEGVVPIPPGQSLVRYQYKLDYNYNAFGKPKSATKVSPEYTLKVTE
jgi:hypothetical protein